MKRRVFLGHAGAAVGNSWIMMNMPAMLAAAGVAADARAEGAGFQVLSPSEAVEFDAIAAQIIPSGDTPGAREAGVVWFMDAVLAGSESGALEPLRQGLSSLQADVHETHGAGPFSRLDNGQQIKALQRIEDTPFFNTLRFLTVAGTFCNPSQGGNRDGVGWKLIGFEGPMPAQPPFGYYDADYAEKGA